MALTSRPPPSEEMHRYRRIAEVWNWLPAFRVVAEYESIHKAAAVLCVSASALSRTVKLLEASLGVPLFVRTNGGLELTAVGLQILDGTRDAMRTVDDAWVLATPSSARQIVGVGTIGASVTPLVARAVGRIARRPSSSRFRMIELDAASAEVELLRGNVDIVLMEDARLTATLVHHALGALPFALFGSSGSVENEKKVQLEGWAFEGPAEVTADSVDAVAHLAYESGFLALLPVGLAPPHFELLRWTDETVAVHALTRATLGSAADEGARAVLDAVRAFLRDVEAQRADVARPTACAGRPPTLPAAVSEPSVAARNAASVAVPPSRT